MLAPVTPVSPRERLHFLDALRIAAFVLLVLYHVGMYYVSWPWHVKSPAAGSGLEPWLRLSSPWRLSLLFLLSGVATSYMLGRSGASIGLLRTRVSRLGLPVLLGMALLVPPQAYFEVRQFHAYSGGYPEFLRLYFSGFEGFCAPSRGCLLLPTWNHLWFVVYLLVYTVLWWGFVRIWPTLPERTAAWLQRALAGARMWWLPVVLLAALRLALIDRFPPTHALVDDVYLHACYVAFFVAGAAMAQLATPWPRIDAARWISFALAFAGWLAMLIASPGSDLPDTLLTRGLARVGFATMQWCAVLAALGFAHRHWNRDFAWRARLTEAVFTVYLVHQTVLIALAVALAPLALSAPVEGVLLALGTFALSAGCHALVRRVPVLRPWFGLAPRRAVPPAPQAVVEGVR